jgi:hypothetical protein
MKLIYYFFLPLLVIGNYWMYIGGALIVVFIIPGDWWKKSPASQPDQWIGKLIPFLKISLRNLTLRVLAILAFFLFMPFALLLPVGILLILPFVIVAKVFGKKSESEEMSVFGMILIACFIVMIVGGLLAPVNLIPVALYYLMGKPAGNAVETLVTGGHSVRDDALIGLLGILLIALILFLDAFWRLKQARQIENLATSKISSISMGLVEIKGTARSLKNSNEPILQLKMNMFSYFQPEQTLEPFEVEDETGRVLVDTGKSHIRAGWITDLVSLFTGFHEIILTRRVELDDRTDATTKTLMDGDPVYVIGTAQRNPNQDHWNDRLVIKPSERSNWNPSFWRFLFGSEKPPPGRDYTNIFFISDSAEEAARKHVLRGFRTVWLISFFWLAISALLVWSSTWPTRQEPNPEGWRNAYWRGPEPNPNLSVLDYTRNHRIFRFEKYLQTLTPESEEAIPALLEAMAYRDSRFVRPATAALMTMKKNLIRPEEVVPVLQKNLQTNDAHLLQTTILALGSFGPRAESAVPDLIEQLKCRSTNTYEVSPNIIRFQAARALGNIGAAATEAIPALRIALTDPTPAVRSAAQEALRKIEIGR